MTTKAIVGPVPSVRFHDGTKVAYRPPRDTVDDNRWRSCTDHHVACDCREAEMAEQILELRGELKAAQDAARRILAGHPTYAYEASPTGREREVGCMCTGCVIAREAYLLAHSDADRMARDEVDGLDGDQVAAGVRWQICHDGVRKQHPGVCGWAVTRLVPGRLYHEHLTTADGTPISDTDEGSPF